MRASEIEAFLDTFDGNARVKFILDDIENLPPNTIIYIKADEPMFEINGKEWSLKQWGINQNN